MGLRQQVGGVLPVDVHPWLEDHPNPATGTKIGRAEEPLWVFGDEGFL